MRDVYTNGVPSVSVPQAVKCRAGSAHVLLCNIRMSLQCMNPQIDHDHATTNSSRFNQVRPIISILAYGKL